MDIVYTVKQSLQNEELRYSLRSLENIPHDRVFIVGYVPHFINKETINYISIPQASSKYQNTTNNLKQVCKLETLSDNFILMNDDFYVNKPIQNVEEELNLYRGEIEGVLRFYNAKYPLGTEYSNGMKQTKELLEGLGIEKPLSYELHTPFIFNKEKFLSMFDIPGVKDIPVLHKRSLYGNLFYDKTKSKKILDVKVLKEPNSFNYPNMKLISTSDHSFLHYSIREYLERRFPKKSKYENKY